MARPITTKELYSWLMSNARLDNICCVSASSTPDQIENMIWNAEDHQTYCYKHLKCVWYFFTCSVMIMSHKNAWDQYAIFHRLLHPPLYPHLAHAAVQRNALITNGIRRLESILHPPLLFRVIQQRTWKWKSRVLKIISYLWVTAVKYDELNSQRLSLISQQIRLLKWCHLRGSWSYYLTTLGLRQLRLITLKIYY